MGRHKMPESHSQLHNPYYAHNLYPNRLATGMIRAGETGDSETEHQ